MARAPVPGHVKTRLQPQLSGEQCAALHTAFLQDTVALAASASSFASFLAYTPSDAESIFKRYCPPDMEIFPQDGGDLGERMNNIIVGLYEREYSPVVVIGSDVPALQPDTLRKAAESTGKDNICLGPAVDGGYYLIAMRRPFPELFTGIRWGSSTVLTSTIRKAKAAGLSIVLLEKYSDVDLYTDLDRLRTDMSRLKHTPGARVPQSTDLWLQDTSN
jgi:uncharacterized protein